MFDSNTSPKLRRKGRCMGFQQLGAVERDWRTTSQGDRSKAREIPAPKRRACFKEDKALNGVQIDKRGLVVSIGLATWRLLVVVKRAVSEDRGKETRLGSVTE